MQTQQIRNWNVSSLSWSWTLLACTTQKKEDSCLILDLEYFFLVYFTTLTTGSKSGFWSGLSDHEKAVIWSDSVWCDLWSDPIRFYWKFWINDPIRKRWKSGSSHRDLIRKIGWIRSDHRITDQICATLVTMISMYFCLGLWSEYLLQGHVACWHIVFSKNRQNASSGSPSKTNEIFNFEGAQLSPSG